jgi:hypothetical protein
MLMRYTWSWWDWHKAVVHPVTGWGKRWKVLHRSERLPVRPRVAHLCVDDLTTITVAGDGSSCHTDWLTRVRNSAVSIKHEWIKVVSGCHFAGKGIGKGREKKR